MSGHVFLPARALIGDQAGTLVLSSRLLVFHPYRECLVDADPSPFPPQGPVAQLGQIRDAWALRGRNQSSESARPPRAPAAGVTHFPLGPFRESLPLLSVSLDYSSACLRRCVAAALEFKGKPTRFLFSSCPLSPPSSDFLTANQYYFLALLPTHPPFLSRFLKTPIPFSSLPVLPSPLSLCPLA